MAETSPKDAELTLATLSKSQRRKLQKLSRQDELRSTMGILNAFLTVAIAVRLPAQYWIWHLLRTSIYIPLRYLKYKKQNYELFLLDWCYVVTYLSTICSIVAFIRVFFHGGSWNILTKYNSQLIRSGFAMACGPLSWSVFVFRNSVVFHDVDRSTSVFIHLSPFVLFWCFRWGAGVPSVINDAYPTMFHVCDSPEEFHAADLCFDTLGGMIWCDACPASPWQFIIPPAVLYLGIWSIPYFWIVLVKWRGWCQSTGKETLYSYVCQTSPQLMTSLKSLMQPLVGENYAGELGYMTFHFVTSIVTCSGAYIMWHSFILHTAVMVLVLAKAVDNGSSYMFKIFAYRYAQEQLDAHKQKLL